MFTVGLIYGSLDRQLDIQMIIDELDKHKFPKDMPSKLKTLALYDKVRSDAPVSQSSVYDQDLNASSLNISVMSST